MIKLETITITEFEFLMIVFISTICGRILSDAINKFSKDKNKRRIY